MLCNAYIACLVKLLPVMSNFCFKNQPLLNTMNSLYFQCFPYRWLIRWNNSYTEQRLSSDFSKMEASKHLPVVCDKLTKELLADGGYNHDESDSQYVVNIVWLVLVSDRRQPFLSNVLNPAPRKLSSWSGKSDNTVDNCILHQMFSGYSSMLLLLNHSSMWYNVN